MTKVRIAVLNQGTIRTELVRTLVVLSHDPRYDLEFTYPAEQPIAYNRNKICKDFRESGADVLLMIDDDQWWTKNPLDYVDHDLDVLGFPTLVCQPTEFPDEPLRWNMTYDAPLPEEDMVEVTSIGAGSLLIARRVLEHPKMGAPFMDVWNKDGLRFSSEDLHFCKRVRDNGFKVWATTETVCDHVKEIPLLLMHRMAKQCSS